MWLLKKVLFVSEISFEQAEICAVRGEGEVVVVGVLLVLSQVAG